jgi:hypothetical protein
MIAGLRELVCGNWLHYYYLAKPCPDHIIQWLFLYSKGVWGNINFVVSLQYFIVAAVCNQHDQHVVTKAFQTLWSWAELRKEVYLHVINVL